MDLFDAFGLAPGAVVTAVGGGGKTSLVYALAAEGAARGLTAVVTTSVKFTRPPGWPMPPIVEASGDSIGDALRAALRPGSAVAAISGYGTHGRMHGFECDVIDNFIAPAAEIIAIEGDGSSHRPFKAPAEHEPVIPASTTDVVVCVGLEVLGRPLDAPWVHRPEIVSALAETAQGEPVTAGTIIRVLLHPLGGRKNLPAAARLHALLNNPQTSEHQVLAEHIAQRLVYGGYARVVVAAAHRTGDIRAVVK